MLSILVKKDLLSKVSPSSIPYIFSIVLQECRYAIQRDGYQNRKNTRIAPLLYIVDK
jgi:hypothetical protein